MPENKNFEIGISVGGSNKKEKERKRKNCRNSQGDRLKS